MPVTMTVHEIARRIRVDLAEDDVTSDVYLDLLDLLESSTNEVERYAGSQTPDANLNTSLVRLIGYVWDSPGSWRNANFASAFLNSGAAHALNPWRDAQGRGTKAADVPRRVDTPESGIMSPADADALQQAIADYLAQHPIETEKGDKGDKGDDSTVAGPRGQRGLTGEDSIVPGPRGAASVVPGPRGPGPTDAAIAAAVAAYAAANPSGGAVRTVLFDGSHACTNLFTKITPGGNAIVCPATGTIEVYLRAAGGNRQGAVASCTMPATDLRASFRPLGGGSADSNTNNRSLPLGANRYIAIAVEDGSHHIMIATQRTDLNGNYIARIVHIAE